MKYCTVLLCSGIVYEEKDDECATCKFGKLNVILDLDETLVYSGYKWFKYENIKPFIKFNQYKVYKRPYVDDFLDAVFKQYNVYI